MRGTDEILSAIDSDEGIARAIIRVYQNSIQRNTGQHDLDRCRICHEEAGYWTGILTHKADCPVGQADQCLREFDEG